MSVRPFATGDLAAARELLRASCAFDEGAAEVAEEKLCGASPPGLEGAAWAAWGGDGALVGVAAQAGKWLRLLAVAPAARRRGVGGTLLAVASERARAQGASVLRAGGQPGNYLAPGVDERDGATLEWLEKRGFGWRGAAANLRVRLRGNPRVSEARVADAAAAASAAGYLVRRARAADAAALAALAGGFSAAWAFEAARALESEGVHVAALADSGALVAFAAHDGNNRGLGWFGPAGTLAEHRGRGLGEALLLACLRDVAAAGHEQAVIAWIGPRAFYERAAGADEERHFVVMEMAL